MPHLSALPPHVTAHIVVSPCMTTGLASTQNIRNKFLAFSQGCTATMNTRAVALGWPSVKRSWSAMADESGSSPIPDKAPPSTSPSQGHEEISPFREITILLIEDNAADVTLIRSALRERGLLGPMSIIRAGDEAIKFATEIDQHPDLPIPGLVILDLNLPRVNGRDVLKRFRSGRLCAAPVVILSSSDAEKDKQITAELGARRYIKKPMSLSEFMDIGRQIEEVLTHQM
jgi:CheY-like chemotaxis protein